MWIITKDHAFDPDLERSKEGTMCAPEVPHGVHLPYDATAKEIKSKGTHFKIYDDDGELYYSGYSTDDSSFSPLLDFAQPYAGATEIRYRNKETGKYETL